MQLISENCGINPCVKDAKVAKYVVIRSRNRVKISVLSTRFLQIGQFPDLNQLLLLQKGIRNLDLLNFPHRRYNPLTGKWVLVSPHRTKRPWQGKVEPIHNDERPQYDSKCYLCPGNERAGGHKNPKYLETFVFTNDFSALLENNPTLYNSTDTLFTIRGVKGTCRVICFSPRHDLTLAEMTAEEIEKVIKVWAEQIADLSKTYQWVQIFENKGEIMGCSNPHPHGQIWASDNLPNEPFKEDQHQRMYYKKHDVVLLKDYFFIRRFCVQQL